MWLIALAIILLIVVAPVMIAARIVGARRTGFWISLLAMIVSLLIVAVAVRVLHGLGLLSMFVAPFGYMLILDTTYLRALGIVVLQYLISLILAVVLATLLFGGLMHGIDRLKHEAPINFDAPAQSV
jgi:hypothetical protein